MEFLSIKKKADAGKEYLKSIFDAETKDFPASATPIWAKVYYIPKGDSRRRLFQCAFALSVLFKSVDEKGKNVYSEWNFSMKSTEKQYTKVLPYLLYEALKTNKRVVNEDVDIDEVELGILLWNIFPVSWANFTALLKDGIERDDVTATMSFYGSEEKVRKVPVLEFCFKATYAKVMPGEEFVAAFEGIPNAKDHIAKFLESARNNRYAFWEDTEQLSARAKIRGEVIKREIAKYAYNYLTDFFPDMKEVFLEEATVAIPGEEQIKVL